MDLAPNAIDEYMSNRGAGARAPELEYPPFICHLTLSCDGMNTPLFNHVCVTVCLSTPLLKCPFEKGLCPVPWGGWFQNDLSITPDQRGLSRCQPIFGLVQCPLTLV